MADKSESNISDELLLCHKQSKQQILDSNEIDIKIKSKLEQTSNNVVKDEPKKHKKETTTTTTTTAPIQQKTIKEKSSIIILNPSQKRKNPHRPNATDKSSHHEVNEKRLKIDKTLNTQASNSLEQNAKRVVTKPPLPPKDQKPITATNAKKSTSESIEPPSSSSMGRTKKIQSQTNALLIQKLISNSDQLRLEISELKLALVNEKNAVRELRALNDSENRKAKIEIKRKQMAQLESTKKSTTKRKAPSLSSDDLSPSPSAQPISSDEKSTNDLLAKLNQEICLLKDANKCLEEKNQISSQAERRKIADIRELKDSYEQRLTQISKSAKIEMHRLLEEIKAKEKTIEQLKKENSAIKASPAAHRKDGKNVTATSSAHANMRKEKEIERTNNHNNQNNNNSSSCSSISSSTNNKINNTSTCGDKSIESMPHEIHERTQPPEAHNTNNNKDLQFYDAMIDAQDTVAAVSAADAEIASTVAKDPIGSDNDSALSSAPQSLSPQPGTFHHHTDVWQTFVKESQKEVENLQKDFNMLRDENQLLSCELSQAKEQIVELDKALFASHETNVELHNRIGFFEQKSETLLKESHELREQNELLEFRIIELEESHDKWSLRSNVTPDTRDMWTDTDQESDFVPMLLMSERSDSGITSPYSHRHIDISSPCDLSSLETFQNDDVRRRIMAMTKKQCYEEDDRLCLLQVLSLLNNLEAMSQDQEIGGDDFQINYHQHQQQQQQQQQQQHQNTNLLKDSTNFYTQTLPSTKFTLGSNNNNNNYKLPERIVATVQPYTSERIDFNINNSSDKNTDQTSTSARVSFQQQSPKKCFYRSTLSLQESGVFEEEDDDDEVGGDENTFDSYTQSTQTDDSFCCITEQTNCNSSSSGGGSGNGGGDLCAEIQKLNKFRKKIEECVTKSNAVPPVVSTLLNANSCDQRRLDYYKERLELLENKILVYESSGDIQVRHLAERLQREIQLEAWVKQLTERVDKLAEENSRLEEEKCEFEEAENDTRLRLQRLEVDLEMLRQRNGELEMSRDTAKAHAACLQESINKAQQRIYHLEEQRNDLKHRMEMLKMFMPTILMFNAWKTQEAHREPLRSNLMSESNAGGSCNSNTTTTITTTTGNCPCVDSESYAHVDRVRLQELMSREKELTSNIAELNRAYNETLESADNLWAQMEKEYKDKLADAEDEKLLLKNKLEKYEERLRNNAQCANERIIQLEESELALKHRVCKLNRELKDQTTNHTHVMEEFTALQEECGNLKRYIEGPAAEAVDKERKRIRQLEDELGLTTKIQAELEQVTANQLLLMKTQLTNVNRDLINCTVSNGELKEEVTTLEKRVLELLAQHEHDQECIEQLTEENQMKIDELEKWRGPTDGRNLADELQANCENYDPKCLEMATASLAAALNSMENCTNCYGTNEELRDAAVGIKNLANSILSKQQKPERVSVDENHPATSSNNEIVNDAIGDGDHVDANGGDGSLDNIEIKIESDLNEEKPIVDEEGVGGKEEEEEEVLRQPHFV